jgi:hypothetical protein
MNKDNETTIFILIIGVIMLVYNFSEPINENFSLKEYKCPIYDKKSKIISIVHHPKMNKGFIIHTSSKEANTIIQKSLKEADGEYNIKNNGKNYYLSYKNDYVLQNILEYTLKNYEDFKNKSGFKLMSPT